MKVIPFQPQSPLPDDMPAILRGIADSIGKGEVTTFIAAFTSGNEYCFVRPSSLVDSVVLTNLLHERVMQGFHK